MPEKLKPCPFCGGKMERKIGYKRIYFFSCKSCGAIISFDNDLCNSDPKKASTVLIIAPMKGQKENGEKMSNMTLKTDCTNVQIVAMAWI